MTRKTYPLARAALCLLLAALLAAPALPARAAAELTASVTPAPAQGTHGQTIHISFSMSMPVATAEGSSSISLSVYLEGGPFAAASVSGPNSYFQQEGVINFTGGWDWAIPNVNADSVAFTWTCAGNVNGEADEESGGFSIQVLHTLGAWAHAAGTDGDASRHERACACGKTESEPCSFSPWAHAQGTQGSDSRHERTCSVCGETQSQGCAFTPTVVVAAMCEAHGDTEYTCGLCGYAYNAPLPDPLGHAWGLWASGNNGTHTRLCGNDPAHTQTAPCDYLDTVTLPSCEEEGYTAHACPVCGYSFQDARTPPLGHDWRAAQVVPPACGTEGWTLMRCARCGDELRTDFLPALSHWYGPWSPVGEDAHRADCRRGCGHTGKAACLSLAAQYGGTAFSACPVCGRLSLGGAETVMEAAAGAGVQGTPGNALPRRGELAAFVFDAPEGLGVSLLRLYALSWEHNGNSVETGGAQVTLPLGGELPAFRLARLDGGAQEDVPFQVADGMLTFTAALPGVFALVASP